MLTCPYELYFEVPLVILVVYHIDSDISEDEHCEIWSSEDNVGDDEIIDESIPLPVENLGFESPSNQSVSLSKWILYFLMLMQTKFKLSGTVISFFLKFFIVFLSILGKISKQAADISGLLPPSLYSARLLENQAQYVRYVVCKRCHKIYYLRDCLEGTVPQHSRCCDFIQFPNHTQHRMRSPCGSLLLKTVELAGGRTHFYPFMTYCYLNVDVSLQMLQIFVNCGGGGWNAQ